MIAPLALALAAAAAAPSTTPSDPYQWLEDINGAKPLAQVKEWNAETAAKLTAVPGYEEHRQRALAILNDPANLVVPTDVIGDRVLNHWVDAAHPRGLWRVASLASFASGKPDWRVLIDVDALGKKEDKSWVWEGAKCLAPAYERCLVQLSPGGGDANVVREFDLATGQFVAGGFEVPLSKNNVDWVDRDHLLVGYAHGGTSETRSGYPRQVLLWTRGTPLATSPVVLEGTEGDIGVGARHLDDGATRYALINRDVGFFATRYKIRSGDGRWVDLPVPETSELQGAVGGKVVVRLVDPIGDLNSGSLVSYELADIFAGRPAEPSLVFAPSARQSVETVKFTDTVLWLHLLDDVSGTLLALRPGATGWSRTEVAVPANGTLELAAAAATGDRLFLTAESLLSPPQLLLADASGTARTIQALPAQFDAAQFTVDQYFALSKDGTRVPYFVVRKKSVQGPVNTLIHAYGGFNVSQTPTYLTGQPYRSGPLGLFVVEDGGAYVLANLRGGGEYGPTWWKAALREKRQNAFDDLEAVARDLIKAEIARRNGVVISGRSNGGVLTSVGITQHPDLYAAAIIGSPLIDMKRYSHLSAGASWIDEYGDPDKPEDWAFIGKYSAYQHVQPGVKYPPVFMYLSTQDDRVHPGHARKFTALLKANGNPVYYHEYLEGGHAVGADRPEDAVRAAMEWAFLKTVLPAN
jgi:prolyl oligopeptidase